MKILNLRKKIGATLLAAGMITPVAAHAAGVNVNLLADPSFESVNTAVSGPYGVKQLTSWSDGSQTAWTYNYAQGFAKDASPPPSPGNTYFTANFLTPLALGPGQISQNVDVSTGAAAAKIASGNATYALSGWFGNYGFQFGGAHPNTVLHLDFLNGTNVSLGTASIQGIVTSSSSFNWHLRSGGGAIPAGTVTVQASLYADGTGDNEDAHADLVSFQVTPEPSTVILAGIGILGAGAFSRKRKA